jgi:hypothetical protein
VHCIHASKIRGNFAFLFKTQRDRDFSYIGGIELVIDVSATNFNMTFVELLCFRVKQFEFSSNMNSMNSNNNLNFKKELLIHVPGI